MAAKCLNWYQCSINIKSPEFDYYAKRGTHIKWYEVGILNVFYNCLNHHIEYNYSIAQEVGLIFESDTSTECRYYVTYDELLRDVKNFANVLKKHGVKKGDHVIVCMHMVVEACVALLAYTRTGGIHSVVFEDFSAKNVAEHISDCDSAVVTTTDFGV